MTSDNPVLYLSGKIEQNLYNVELKFILFLLFCWGCSLSEDVLSLKLSKNDLTCSASVKLNPHRDVTSPTLRVQANKTRQNRWIDGLRDNTVTVTVSLKVLKDRWMINSWHSLPELASAQIPRLDREVSFANPLHWLIYHYGLQVDKRCITCPPA